MEPWHTDLGSMKVRYGQVQDVQAWLMGITAMAVTCYDTKAALLVLSSRYAEVRM